MSQGDRGERERDPPRGPDSRALYRLAERQHGLFTVEQAREAGYGSSLVAYHARRGRFRRLGSGLYQLEDFPHHPHAFMVRAWLEAGGRRTDAVLTHRSALALHGLLDPPTGGYNQPAADVTVPRSARWVRVSRGVAVHTVKEPIPDADRDDEQDLPVTTLIRSVLDATQGRVLRSGELVRVLGRIDKEGPVRPLDVKDAAWGRSYAVGRAVERGFRMARYGKWGLEMPVQRAGIFPSYRWGRRENM